MICHCHKDRHSEPQNRTERPETNFYHQLFFDKCARQLIIELFKIVGQLLVVQLDTYMQKDRVRPSPAQALTQIDIGLM